MESPSSSQDSSSLRPSSLILSSRSKGTKSREEMESPPSSPTSLVVSSPRRTLSLLRERRSSTFSSDHEGRKSPAAMAGFAAEHGPKPSEVYGFVGSITTVISTVIYFVWAYTPEPWLQSLGITYYPSKHWALAVPTFFMVTIVLVIAFYIGLNFMVTPPPTSFDTMFDEYSTEPTTFVPMEGEEKPIEPISDMDITNVNSLMFGMHHSQHHCDRDQKQLKHHHH